MKFPTLVYIHGANATDQSFNFLRELLNYEDEIALSYQSADGFDNNLAAMVSALSGVSNIFFVAHSLGGLYALHLADLLPNRVVGAFTIASPYGGSNAARMLRLVLPTYHPQLMRDITPTSAVVTRAKTLPLHHPWTAVVTTKGHSSLMPEPNDGVVTERSMCCRPDMQHIYVPANHFEVLQDYHTLSLLREALNPHLPLTAK